VPSMAVWMIHFCRSVRRTDEASESSVYQQGIVQEVCTNIEAEHVVVICIGSPAKDHHPLCVPLPDLSSRQGKSEEDIHDGGVKVPACHPQAVGMSLKPSPGAQLCKPKSKSRKEKNPACGPML
jgi:hypothetical protein